MFKWPQFLPLMGIFIIYGHAIVECVVTADG
jgi:hypothetical protein